MAIEENAKKANTKMDGIGSERRYAVTKCTNCQNAIVVDVRFRRRRCPRCGKRIMAQPALTTRRFTADEAAEFAKTFKMKEHQP